MCDNQIEIVNDTQSMSDMTTADSRVTEEDFNQGGTRSPLELIQGRVAGLSITRTGGSNPNAGTARQLRGVTSIHGDQSPLIVIDGIPGGNLDLLQPTDIESFEDRKSTRLNSSHVAISYAVFCLTKK